MLKQGPIEYDKVRLRTTRSDSLFQSPTHYYSLRFFTTRSMYWGGVGLCVGEVVGSLYLGVYGVEWRGQRSGSRRVRYSLGRKASDDAPRTAEGGASGACTQLGPRCAPRGRRRRGTVGDRCGTVADRCGTVVGPLLDRCKLKQVKVWFLCYGEASVCVLWRWVLYWGCMGWGMGAA